MTELEEMLARHEGFRSKPYRCPAGKTTVGYGRNLDDVGLTPEESVYLLRNDIARVTRDLKNYRWFTEMAMARQDALVDMAVNLGIAGLFKFHKMIRAVQAQDYLAASTEMLASQWARQVGRRATELAAMMRTGRYPDG